MRMAQSGQLRGRVSEEQLIELLDQVRLTHVRSKELAQSVYTSRSTERSRRPRLERARLWYVYVFLSHAAFRNLFALLQFHHRKGGFDDDDDF